MKRKLLLKLMKFAICGFMVQAMFVGMIFASSVNGQQNQTVTGSVISQEDDQPLIGVSVIIKGTTQGTVTDANGEYTLEVTSDESVLVFSFVGYQTEEVQVGTQSVINLTMMPDISTLSEIVVIGYGVQKKASVTGAVSSVDAEKLSQVKVADVNNALQGRVPGVTVTSTGDPGSSPTVRIRGIGSITGNSNPLYVVDGMPTGKGGISNLDPNDIESIEVLKDAASAAIYGSRAANGVILITTKGGSKTEGISVNVESYYGVQSAWKKLDLLDRDQYLEYGEELLDNAGVAHPARWSNMNEPIYAGASQTYAQTNTDWQDEVFQTGSIYSAAVSVAASGEKSKIFASAGAFGNEGIMKGTNFNRYNFRFNSEIEISDHITFGQTMSIANTSRSGLPESGGRTITQHMIHHVPYIPVHDPTLLGGYRSANGADGSDPENPVQILLLDSRSTKGMKVLGTGYLNIKILPYLSYKVSIGLDYDNWRNSNSLHKFNDSYRGRDYHQIQDQRFTTISPLYQNQLTFDKMFGKHSVNAILVGERQDTKSSNLQGQARQASDLVYALNGGTSVNLTNGDQEYTLLSYLARVNYDFAGKYLLSVSMRRDGYSGFAPGKQWGNFPGASIGWRISEESFMNSIPAISELKLRGSYGSLGNYSNVGYFAFQSSISLNAVYPFNNNNDAGAGGSYFTRLPNEDLGWETTDMTNIGLDLGLFEDKVTLTFEYFNRNVDNLLLDLTPPESTGGRSLKANVGKMTNSGFEVQAGYRKITGDFNFNLSGNIGVVKNEVKDLFTVESISAGAHQDMGAVNITRTEVGEPIQGFYGYQVEGIFQSNEEVLSSAVQNLPFDANGNLDMAAYNDPGNIGKYTRAGDLKFKDLNGDGVINDDDKDFIGSYMPDFTYGLNFDASYKGFDLTLFLQGVYGNEIYNGTKVLSQGMQRLFNAETAVLDAWTPQNTNTDIPRAISGDPNGNGTASDRFVEDGSYMRLKTLSIGYSLPESLLSSFANGAIKKTRIYISGQNLLTFTSYSGYDPEVASRGGNSLTFGFDQGQFPQPRTIMGGIQLGF